MSSNLMAAVLDGDWPSSAYKFVLLILAGWANEDGFILSLDIERVAQRTGLPQDEAQDIINDLTNSGILTASPDQLPDGFRIVL